MVGPKTTRSRIARNLLRLMGPVLLILVVWRLDNKELLWESIRHADASLLGVAVALNAVVIHVKVLRWRSLLEARGFPCPLGRAYVAVLSSVYLGMLTPGRVGDALRIQYVRREIETPYAEGIATTLMDRVCDLYVVAVIAALGSASFSSSLRDDLALAIWTAVAISLGLPLLLFIRAFYERMGGLLRRISARWHAGFEDIIRALRGLIRRSLVVGVPLTVIAFGVNYVQGWLAAQAIGVDLDYFQVAALLSVTSLLSLLPISISGVGVRELFFAVVFPTLGLLPAEGVAFGLMVLAVIYVATVLAGFLAWQISPPPFDATRTTDSPQEP